MKAKPKSALPKGCSLEKLIVATRNPQAAESSAPVPDKFSNVTDVELIAEVQRRDLRFGTASPLLPVVTLLEATIFFLEQQGRESPRLDAVRALVQEYREEIFS